MTYRRLVVREAVNLLLKVLNLGALLLVDGHLIGQIFCLSLVLFIHLFDPGAESFLLLLSFGKLNFDVPKRLLQLINFCLCHSQLLDDLSRPYDVCGLHHIYVWRELRCLLLKDKNHQLTCFALTTSVSAIASEILLIQIF